MDGALEAARLLGGELEAERLARVRDRVVDAQSLEARLRLRGQGVVGAAHVRVLRVRAGGRDDLRGQHRVAARRILERRVGMPEPVPEPVHPPAVVGPRDVPALVEVRDVDRARRCPSGSVPGRPCRSSSGAGRPDAAAKASCSASVKGWFAEHQHRVLVHAGPDLVERLGVVRLAQIDRADLGGEVWVQRVELESHPTILLRRAGELPGTPSREPRGTAADPRAPGRARRPPRQGDRSIAGAAQSRRGGPAGSATARGLAQGPRGPSGRRARPSHRCRGARSAGAPRPERRSARSGILPAEGRCSREEDRTWVGTTI